MAAAVREGYRLNIPARSVDAVGSGRIEPIVTSQHPGIVIETVKLAEDGSGDVIICLYEAHDAHTTGDITLGFPHLGIYETDLMERASPSGLTATADSEALRLDLRPFRIMTLRARRSPVTADELY